MKKANTQGEALTQAQVILLENEIINRSRTPDQFRLVNNQYNMLQSWHDQHTGWRIYRSPASIRLIRTPVSFIPGYVFHNLQNPRDFACFVWTLWYAETRLNDGGGHSNGQQFLMSQLAERVEEHSATGYLAPHVAPFDFKRLSDRYSLYRALKTLHGLGGLHLEDGSSEEWLNQAGQENALWEFTEIIHSLILALDMEQVRAAAKKLQGNPKTLAPAQLPGLERVNKLQRAWRTLLLGPVLFKYDDPEAFEALRQHQETFQFELGQTYGWQLDLRYEYAMIIRPSGTGLGPFGLLNLTGAADQAALLCCQIIRQKINSAEWSSYQASEGCLVVPESETAEIFRQVREEYGSRWGSTARKISFQELLQDVYEKLRQAALLRGPDRSGNVLILPTMARFSVNYLPEEEPGLSQPQADRVESQQLTFEVSAIPAPAPNQPESKKPDTSTEPSKRAAPAPITATSTGGYNTPQAGQLLGLSQQSVSRWLGTGFIKGERVGNSWVIPAAEIERIQKIRGGVVTGSVGDGESATGRKATTGNDRQGTIPAPPVPGLVQKQKAVAPESAIKKPQAVPDKDGQGYNSAEAGRLLDVSEQTILNWLKKGKIKGEKIGLNWSIAPAEIEQVKRTREEEG